MNTQQQRHRQTDTTSTVEACMHPALGNRDLILSLKTKLTLFGWSRIYLLLYRYLVVRVPAHTCQCQRQPMLPATQIADIKVVPTDRHHARERLCPHLTSMPGFEASRPRVFATKNSPWNLKTSRFVCFSPRGRVPQPTIAQTHKMDGGSWGKSVLVFVVSLSNITGGLCMACGVQASEPSRSLSLDFSLLFEISSIRASLQQWWGVPKWGVHCIYCIGAV